MSPQIGGYYVQWGRRSILTGIIEELPVQPSSEDIARLLAAQPGYELVHRPVVIGDWVTGGQRGQDTCRHGHPRTEATVYLTPQGRVNCRPCRTLASARSKAKRRAERALA